jgi:hypothetical protein
MISFPLGTEMFQFPRCPSLIYVFNQRCCRFATAGFPIRISSDRSLYTAPRGFSQCPTSFFGTWRQGIHRKPLVAYLHDAEKSKLFACSSSCFFFYFLRLPYSVGNVLRRFHTVWTVDCPDQLPSPLRETLVSALNQDSILQSVEMTGLEPVTSALQRRRSPS